MTVPSAAGNADFSIRRSKRQRGAKELTDTGESFSKCLVIDHLGDFGWGQGTVDAEEVCGESSNVRSSRGCSAGDFSLPIIPGGSDVQAGSPDLDRGTIIGEVGLCVIESRSGDSDRFLSAGRRVFFRVLVLASSGYDDGYTAFVKLKMESVVSGVAVTFHPPSAYLFNSLIHNWRLLPSNAQRSNRGAADSPRLFGNPVDASDTVVRWCESVTTSDNKEGKKTYT